MLLKFAQSMPQASSRSEYRILNKVPICLSTCPLLWTNVFYKFKIVSMTIHTVTLTFTKRNLPSRNRNSNKTHGGKLLVIGGSQGMYGAGILSALAATRSGAGYTYLMLDWNSRQLLKHPDILFLKPKISAFKSINAKAYILGPGIGKSTRAKSILNFFIKNKIPNVVLDADGLSLLAKMKNQKIPSSWILTPHEGELSRLLNTSALKIRENPVRSITQAQKKFGCTILLKGSTTYIADGKKILKSKSGTPALAKAGTGDVLAGIIGGLVAQGVQPIIAAALGAYIHGTASQRYLKSGNDVLSLRPLDLIDQLPKTFRFIRAS